MRAVFCSFGILIATASVAVATDWFILDVKNLKALSCQKSDGTITPHMAKQAGAKVDELPGVALGVYSIDLGGSTMYMAETADKCEALKKAVADSIKSK